MRFALLWSVGLLQGACSFETSPFAPAAQPPSIVTSPQGRPEAARGPRARKSAPPIPHCVERSESIATFGQPTSQNPQIARYGRDGWRIAWTEGQPATHIFVQTLDANLVPQGEPQRVVTDEAGLSLDRLDNALWWRSSSDRSLYTLRLDESAPAVRFAEDVRGKPAFSDLGGVTRVLWRDANARWQTRTTQETTAIPAGQAGQASGLGALTHTPDGTTWLLWSETPAEKSGSRIFLASLTADGLQSPRVLGDLPRPFADLAFTAVQDATLLAAWSSTALRQASGLALISTDPSQNPPLRAQTGPKGVEHVAIDGHQGQIALSWDSHDEDGGQSVFVTLQNTDGSVACAPSRIARAPGIRQQNPQLRWSADDQSMVVVWEQGADRAHTQINARVIRWKSGDDAPPAGPR